MTCYNTLYISRLNKCSGRGVKRPIESLCLVLSGPSGYFNYLLIPTRGGKCLKRLSTNKHITPRAIGTLNVKIALKKVQKFGTICELQENWQTFLHQIFYLNDFIYTLLLSETFNPYYITKSYFDKTTSRVQSSQILPHLPKSQYPNGNKHNCLPQV